MNNGVENDEGATVEGAGAGAGAQGGGETDNQIQQGTERVANFAESLKNKVRQTTARVTLGMKAFSYKNMSQETSEADRQQGTTPP